jgi:hypothetical protein
VVKILAQQELLEVLEVDLAQLQVVLRLEDLELLVKEMMVEMHQRELQLLVVFMLVVVVWWSRLCRG